MASGHLMVILLAPGFLALPYIMSSLGWLAAPVAMLVYATLCHWTASMMADVYEVSVWWW